MFSNLPSISWGLHTYLVFLRLPDVFISACYFYACTTLLSVLMLGLTSIFMLDLPGLFPLVWYSNADVSTLAQYVYAWLA